MNEEKFWDLIDTAHLECGSDMERKSEMLKGALEKLAASDASDFSRFFDAAMDGAYTHSLWGAAYLINGGCSDDTFTDFRASLISRGRLRYESAVSNPDTLAEEEFDGGSWFYEGYQYAASEGVEQAVGTRVPRSEPYPADPAGESWEESDEFFQNAYPKLWLKFGGDWQAPAPIQQTQKRPWWKFW